jgi:hypothetical protein
LGWKLNFQLSCCAIRGSFLVRCGELGIVLYAC